MPKPESSWQEPSRNFFDIYKGHSFLSFFDATPVALEVNRNALWAAQVIERTFQDRSGVAIALFSPMAGGKSTTAYLLANGRECPSAAVLKHKLDVERFGYCLQTQGGLIVERIGTYNDFEHLEQQVAGMEADVLIIEEAQFAGGAQEDPRKIESFLANRRKERRGVVVTALDYDFRREPWLNSHYLTQQVDKIFVLAGRCVQSDCEKPSHFTMRIVDGQPAHYDDPPVMVGSVADTYSPACADCHQVLPPRGGR